MSIIIFIIGVILGCSFGVSSHKHLRDDLKDAADELRDADTRTANAVLLSKELLDSLDCRPDDVADAFLRMGAKRRAKVIERLLRTYLNLSHDERKVFLISLDVNTVDDARNLVTITHDYAAYLKEGWHI